MKALRATLCCILILALAALAPGLAPYAAAADVISAEFRGPGSQPAVNRARGGEFNALPSVEIQDLSKVGTLPVVTGARGDGLTIQAIPAEAGLIQTRDASGITAGPEAPTAVPISPEARLGSPATISAEVAPSLKAIAQPNASGEASSRAGIDVETILQGGVARGAGGDVATMPGPTSPSRSFGLAPASALRGKSSRVSPVVFFGAGIIGLGTAAGGGLAAGAIVFPLMIVSFVLHEVAHARVAYWLGDPGPMLENRGSLKPRDWATHFDWLWSFVVPVATYLTIHTIIGGANPVEFKAYRFRTGPVLGAAIAGFAGPAMNLVLAGLGALAFAGLGAIGVSGLWVPVVAALSYAAGTFAVMNAALALFNLMPFYPLDGHFVVNALLPKKFVAGLNDFYATGGALAWIPFVAFMGVVMKFGLGAVVLSWLASFLLGGSGVAAFHLAAAGLPVAAGLMMGRIQDSGVPRLEAQPAVAEHRFMASRLADARRRLAEPSSLDDEWIESLKRQADGYQARVAALETQFPELRAR